MKVLVTGSTSMVGGSVCEVLKKQGHTVHEAKHSECDLLSLEQTQTMMSLFKPEMVVHAAGYNGGIEWNRLYPETIFSRTARMALNVLEAAIGSDVTRVLSIISSCAYPDKGQDVLVASDMWYGLPNPTVECHGLSKRILHAYSRQINKQHNKNYVCAVLTNCYGPRDNTDPLKTKVVMALIKKFVEAQQTKQPEVICWGTGSPRREFMYCEDAAEALVKVLFEWHQSDLINVGVGYDVSIKELSETIANLVGYKGKIVWDTAKPDGQMKKMLDSSALGYKPKTLLAEGLVKTIEWFKEVNK
jgi:GDP-L-fucose synthase